MKKIFFLFSFLIISSNNLLYSQNVSCSYSFSQTVGSYTEITSGTTLPAVDDESFGPYSIGFNFTYNGTVYNSFGVQANGFISLGPTPPANSYTPISSGSTNNLISAFATDLHFINGGILSFLTSGIAGSLVLTVQWKNVRHWNNTQDNYNFQIKLFETSNNVQIAYGPVTAVNQYSLQVGLRGSSTADFSNRSVINQLNTWTTSIAGTVNTDYCHILTTLVPPSGLIYQWAPIPRPTLLSPPNGSTNVSLTPTMDWNDTAGATCYRLQIATDSFFTAIIFDVSVSQSQITIPANVLNTSTRYYWRVRICNACTNLSSVVWNFTTTNVSGINTSGNEIPKEFKLYNNYPNPFNPSTIIKFGIPVETRFIASLRIFDILGREVATLVNENLKPGTYEVEWDASNYPSGVFYYKLTAGDFTDTKKMVLLK
jgi:type IX secretion system substrate protein